MWSDEDEFVWELSLRDKLWLFFLLAELDDDDELLYDFDERDELDDIDDDDEESDDFRLWTSLFWRFFSLAFDCDDDACKGGEQELAPNVTWSNWSFREDVEEVDEDEEDGIILGGFILV